jgi:hypothetical protein
MPEGVQIRGPHQYRAQIRRNGAYQSKTFETLKEAQQWRRVTDGKVSGGELVGPDAECGPQPAIHINATRCGRLRILRPEDHGLG